MLIHPHDAATDDEWRAALFAKDFGQLISAADKGGLPIVVPTHFVFDGHDTIELQSTKGEKQYKVTGSLKNGTLSLKYTVTTTGGQPLYIGRSELKRP